MELRRNTYLWEYLSHNQQDLLLQGEYLLNNIAEDKKYNFKDYSFLVFPFAKAYEGFLKQLFLDVKFISRLDYISNHFRLGKVMSPNLIQKLGERSVYQKILNFSGQELADEIWETWKIGRNEVFHYFPHNLKSLTLSEADTIIEQIVSTMEKAVTELKVDVVKERLKTLSTYQ